MDGPGDPHPLLLLLLRAATLPQAEDPGLGQDERGEGRSGAVQAPEGPLGPAGVHLGVLDQPESQAGRRDGRGRGEDLLLRVQRHPVHGGGQRRGSPRVQPPADGGPEEHGGAEVQGVQATGGRRRKPIAGTAAAAAALWAQPPPAHVPPAETIILQVG